MLQINFHPESDLVDFNQGVKEFKRIWSDEGEKIINKWEEITGLKFAETKINAIIADVRSSSHPLALRYNDGSDIKKANLIHELGHRLLYKKVKTTTDNPSLERHKLLFLVLYDVLRELYGDEFAENIVNRDREHGRQNGQITYAEAWDWALQFKDKYERQGIFRETLNLESFNCV